MSTKQAKLVELRRAIDAAEPLAEPSVSETLAQLIQLAQEGEERAFKALYRRYCRLVYTLAYQMVGNHSDADEVVQETFIRAFKNINRLRNSSSFTSWLYQITINLSIDFRKARTRRKIMPIDDNVENFSYFELATSKRVKNPSQVLENKELLDQITAAIDDLPTQQKAVIILHEIEGLSKKMISEILHCSLVTVRTNLHHARKKLRKTLSRYVSV